MSPRRSTIICRAAACFLLVLTAVAGCQLDKPVAPRPAEQLAKVPAVIDGAAKGVQAGADGNRQDAEIIVAAVNVIQSAWSKGLAITAAESARDAWVQADPSVKASIASIGTAAKRIDGRSSDLDKVALVLSQQSANIRDLTGQVGKLQGMYDDEHKARLKAESETARRLQTLTILAIVIAGIAVAVGIWTKNFRIPAAVGGGAIAVMVIALLVLKVLAALWIIAICIAAAAALWLIVETIIRGGDWKAALHTNPVEDIRDLIRRTPTPKATS